MRILYVTASLPFGTAETFVIPEVEALLRLGHEVLVVPVRPRGPVTSRDAARLVERTVAVPVASRAVVRAAAGAQAAGGVAAIAAVAPPRIVAKNLAVLPKALWLADLLRRSRPDHVHAHWASTPATVAMVASRIARVPWSLTVHRWDIAEGNLLPAKARSAAFVRAISLDGLRDMRARVGGDARLLLLHMGVDLPRRRPPPRTAPVASVLVPGALVPVKGHALMLRALRLLGPLAPTVAVAGDGPLRAKLERLARELRVDDRVSFLGHVPHDILLAELDAGRYDVVALSSVRANGAKEGIPVSLLEAMARWVPAVAPELGAIPELLGGGAGVLVPPGDAAELARALGELVESDERRQALAEAGRRRVEEAFAIDATARRLAQLFEEEPRAGASA